MLSSNQLRSKEETLQRRESVLDGFALRTSSLWLTGLVYTLLWWALLLVSSLAPGSLWLTGSIEASPASQVMAGCAILTPFLVPFVVYFPVSLTKARSNSFTSAQLVPAKKRPGYWKQVGECCLATLIPLLSVYVLFALMSWLGFLTRDQVTAVILGPSFLIVVAGLTLLASTSSVGLAMSDSHPLHLIAMTVACSAVVLPFILSEAVTGTRLEGHLISFVQGLRGTSPSILIVPLLSSLLVGSLFSWLYRHKTL